MTVNEDTIVAPRESLLGDEVVQKITFAANGVEPVRRPCQECGETVVVSPAAHNSLDELEERGVVCSTCFNGATDTEGALQALKGHFKGQSASWESVVMMVNYVIGEGKTREKAWEINASLSLGADFTVNWTGAPESVVRDFNTAFIKVFFSRLLEKESPLRLNYQDPTTMTLLSKVETEIYGNDHLTEDNLTVLYDLCVTQSRMTPEEFYDIVTRYLVPRMIDMDPGETHIQGFTFAVIRLAKEKGEDIDPEGKALEAIRAILDENPSEEGEAIFREIKEVIEREGDK